MAPAWVRGCAERGLLSPATQADASRRRNGPRKDWRRPDGIDVRPITVRLRSKSCARTESELGRKGSRVNADVKRRHLLQASVGSKTRSAGRVSPTSGSVNALRPLAGDDNGNQAVPNKGGSCT